VELNKINRAIDTGREDVIRVVIHYSTYNILILTMQKAVGTVLAKVRIANN
jgi:hypothetical protein